MAIGGLVVLGTGAVAYRAHDQGVFATGEGPAYAPWRTWQSGDGLRRLVQAAILAPSPHNTQAWLFRLEDAHIDVFADRTRRLGAMDPFDRELHVGIGAAVENLVIAARAEGWTPTVEIQPSDDPTHLARIALSASTARKSALYRQIPRRRTNRYPFVTGRDVDRAAREAMSALALPGVEVIWIVEPRARREFGDLLVAATREIVADPSQLAADHAWFRQRWDTLQQRRDGLTLDAAGLSSLVTIAGKLLPAQSPGELGEAWLEATEERHTATAAAYGIVVVDDAADAAARLRGGRTLQRVHLWATGAGLALHHMNQITERADREVVLESPRRFGPELADRVPSGRQALCAFRIGHPTRPAGLSPRRPVEDVCLS